MRKALVNPLRSLGRFVGCALIGTQHESTLDQLRGDLSHEVTAKIARLAMLSAEWRRGRYEPSDAADALAILADLEATFCKHARLAAGRTRTLFLLARAELCVSSLRRLVQPTRAARPLGVAALDRLEARIAELTRRARALADALSLRYAARLHEIVSSAADEIRREVGGGLRPHSVSVVVDSSGSAAATWVPRCEAERWHDLCKNLIRNAVQATEDAGHTDAPGGRRPEVRVQVGPTPGSPATRIEIRDSGVGMPAAMVQRMWEAGVGTHGSGKGRGLTEGKRAFVEARAALSVRSIPGQGTSFQIDVRRNEIIIPRLRFWGMRPVVGLLAVVALVPAAGWLLQERSAPVMTDVQQWRIVRGLDSDGSVLWQKPLTGSILENRAGAELQLEGELCPAVRPLASLRGADGRIRSVFVATTSEDGPGSICCLGKRGDVEWQRRLRMPEPGSPRHNREVSRWQALVEWRGGASQALMLDVRDSNYSPNMLLFLSLDGDSLGAYCHPGNLGFHSAQDFDDDGRTEILLFGINNWAGRDSAFAHWGGEQFIDCVALLEPPAVSGQAWPYQEWPGMPPACEEGYLLITPLAPGMRPMIHMITVRRETNGAGADIRVWVSDGRIYSLDEHLFPQGCQLGSDTPAERVLRGRAPLPLIHFQRGQRRTVAVPLVSAPL